MLMCTVTDCQHSRQYRYVVFITVFAVYFITVRVEFFLTFKVCNHDSSDTSSDSDSGLYYLISHDICCQTTDKCMLILDFYASARADLQAEP